MRYLLLLMAMAFASPVFGQDARSAVPENPQTANWSKLGPAVEGARGFTLSGRGIRLNANGQYEMWVKIVPNEAAAFIKRYDLPRGTAYVMQYATVDCTKMQLSLEKTVAFDGVNKALEGRITGITPSARKDTVKKGSIGESLFKYVCEEPTALPMTQGHE